MKKVTKYQSDNGVAYDTANEAIYADKVFELSEQLNNSDIYWRETDPTKIAELILSKYDLVPKVNLKA
jgi:hypothetical protein